MLRRKHARRVVSAGLCLAIAYVSACHKTPLAGVCVIMIVLAFGMGED